MFFFLPICFKENPNLGTDNLVQKFSTDNLVLLNGVNFNRVQFGFITF